MATTGTDVRKVGVSDLRGIILDSDEIAKGTDLFDRKILQSLARHGNKLYCEIQGNAPAPYRVSLTFSETSADIRARCTCPIAFKRPFCKHAAALLVAWSRAPEAFVESDAPPGGARKASVQKGAVQKGDLMKQGIAQVSTLVRELGVAGVAIASGEQAASIRKLGEALRENKLTRLSARTLDLANLLDAAAARRGSLPAVAYTDLVADLLLTARKLDKHLAGEPLDARHVEELIGKTWQKNDLSPVSGLYLLEYAYRRWTTSDSYDISESRFFDLTSGAHHSEKQIAPPPPAPKKDPKPSFAGSVLLGVRGSTYPGYPPIRLKITDLGDPGPADHAALTLLVEKALPDVGSALAAFQEHRKDVFAPDLLPAAIRVDTLFARGQRLEAVDTNGNALHLPDDARIEDRLGTALHEGRLVVLLGDIGIDAALPTLWPLAAVFEGPRGLELRTLLDAAAPVVRRKLPAPEPGDSTWIKAARAASASAAAITLGEVREELAFAFMLGLAGLSARVTEPLAARLRELNLDKQAALLESLVARPAVEDRLDDFVKLYQILGIALVRLAGATSVDRATLTRVPTYESVCVTRPPAWLHPDRVIELCREGELNRYEAAVHYAHYYGGLPPEELADKIYPIWANGSAAPFVVRAFAGKGEQATVAARRALSSPSGRVAKITAILVLKASASREATELLAELARNEADPGLRARARDALDLPREERGFKGDRDWRKADASQQGELIRKLLTAPQQTTREAALDEISTLGIIGAIPALRQAFLSDRAQKIRAEAALALGLLGDTEMAETFVKMLAARKDNPTDAGNAARALGHLGDVRGVEELLAAYAEDFLPKVVAAAIRALGVVAIEPLIALLEARPALAERRGALDVLAQMPDRDLAATLIGRLEQRPRDAAFPDVASLYLKLASVHPDCRRAVAKAILEMLPSAEEQRPLGKAAKKALH